MGSAAPSSFLEYLRGEPDAVALLLLLALVAGAVIVALRAGRRRDRETPDGSDKQPERELVSTWPHLVRLELVAALATLLLVSWWAIALEVPLGAPADPSVTPAVAKAPWFFVGVQELLQYFDAWLAGVVLPTVLIVGLCALPYLDRGEGGEPRRGERAPCAPRKSPGGGGCGGSREAPGMNERAPCAPGSGFYTWRGRPVVLGLTLALLLIWLAPLVVGLLWRGEHWALQPAWRPSTPDEASPRLLLSLAERLHLGPAGGQLLGAGLCLGPLLLVPLAWLRLRRRTWATRLGVARFCIAGALLVVGAGVVLKVVLVGALDIRYLWITPWFRI